MADSVRLSLEDASSLCVRALRASNTSEANARTTAAALVRAEADGHKGHGLSRIPSYAAQAKCGKVDGKVTPELERAAAALIRIDARNGFAYPALDLACDALPAVAKEAGIAAATIFNSHHFGQAGAHAERLAHDGLVAMAFSNSPKAITFWGGREPMMGTNPIAFAAPRENEDPLVIDLALAKVARGKILAAKQAGVRIPKGWALDADGNPTDDPDKALHGSMLPIGDAKGAALVLIVELLAAALTGSHFGYEASSFFEAEGEPPGIGHTIVVFEPGVASGGRFAERMENIVKVIEQTDGARLPGTRRLRNRQAAEIEGIAINTRLIAEIHALIESGETDA